MFSASPNPIFADIYRIVDSEGHVTFTDRPPAEDPAAAPVDLKQTNTQPAAGPAQPAKTTKPASGSGYETVQILQPENDSTVPPGQLDMVVQAATNPELAAGHLLQLLYDGAPWGAPVSATSFLIDNLTRGSHHLQVLVVDENNNTLAQSSSVVIHVVRTSILNPNNPSNPKNSRK